MQCCSFCFFYFQCCSALSRRSEQIKTVKNNDYGSRMNFSRQEVLIYFVVCLWYQDVLDIRHDGKIHNCFCLLFLFSYVMSPVKKIIKTATDENYDITDLKSDDSTDDESKPRKKIPPWAQGLILFVYDSAKDFVN